MKSLQEMFVNAALDYASHRLAQAAGRPEHSVNTWSLEELKRAAYAFVQSAAQENLRTRERQVESQAVIIRDLQQRETEHVAKIAELQVRLEELQKRFELAHETSARRGEDRDDANQRYNALLDRIRDLLPDGDS